MLWAGGTIQVYLRGGVTTSVNTVEKAAEIRLMFWLERYRDSYLCLDARKVCLAALASKGKDKGLPEKAREAFLRAAREANVLLEH